MPPSTKFEVPCSAAIARAVAGAIALASTNRPVAPRIERATSLAAWGGADAENHVAAFTKSLGGCDIRERGALRAPPGHVASAG
jgi:hypothetical protein